MLPRAVEAAAKSIAEPASKVSERSPARMYFIITDSRAAGSSSSALARTPEAVHARHDDRAARPIFKHVGRVAIPHGVAARIIPGIDVLRIRIVVTIDPQACRRPAPALRRGFHGDRPGRP